jgi:hypothetical protein
MLSSFDAASLAILEKLGVIEGLLKSDNEVRPSLTGGISTHSSEVGHQSPPVQFKQQYSPSLERTLENVPYHVNVEKLLAWPVFETLRPNVDLRSLLNTSNESQARSISMAPDFDNDWNEHLVQNFMDNVYIFNPVIGEDHVQAYVRDARFNGIGDDGPSCLLVC